MTWPRREMLEEKRPHAILASIPLPLNEVSEDDPRSAPSISEGRRRCRQMREGKFRREKAV